MKTAAPARAIAYVRVSTDQQAESGLGLESQEAAIRSAASRLRLDLVRVFVDGGTSGKLGIEDRPIPLEAVAALRRGTVLLVAKRDRLGRDVVAVALIERLVAKRGAHVVSAAGEGTGTGDDPSALLMRRLIDSFAEYEAALIATRTRSALAAKRRRGERVSRFAPYGFRFAADGRTVELDPTEQPILVRIREARSAGLSLPRIARDLNQDGLHTRSGSRWRGVPPRDRAPCGLTPGYNRAVVSRCPPRRHLHSSGVESSRHGRSSTYRLARRAAQGKPLGRPRQIISDTDLARTVGLSRRKAVVRPVVSGKTKYVAL